MTKWLSKELIINIILNLNDVNICFLCLKTKELINDFDQIYEIHDELRTNSVTLKLIVKKVITFYDNIVRSQACDDCTQLLLKMYILQTRNETVTNKISNIIGNINREVDLKTADDLTTLRINLNVKSIGETIPHENFRQNNESVDSTKTIHKTLNSDATICETCGRDCKTNKTLKTHLNTHKEVQCPYCLKMLKTHSHYSFHIRRHLTHGKVVKKKTRHKCSMCQYTSWNKTSLNAHMNKSHQKVRPFVCDICHKGFYSNSNLIEHKSTHTKQDIICDVCGEIFLSEKGLTLHLRLHNGEKPYKCSICDLTFVSASRKSEHVKRKHSEPNIQCMYCDKGYRVQKDLNRHLKTHLNDKK